MKGIYIGSTTGGAGKNLLSISLGLYLQKSGFSVGYMKPLGRLPQMREERPGDADALVVQELLGQNAAADLLTPVMVPGNLHNLAVWRQESDKTAMTRIREAYSRLSQGRDYTIVTGSGAFPAAGRFADADGLRIVRELDLRVLFVERYSGGINYDALLLLKSLLGESMLGVVINSVPEANMRDVAGLFSPWLCEQGIAVHGIIPREPELSAMRVLDLARGLNGRVVAGNAHAGSMIKGFVIGTMQVDNFMMHLRRRKGSAVIVGGDRSDLQLAALYEDCPCIILTGNITPTELIRAGAESKGVTLVVVREDTYTVARGMSRILKSKKLRELNQIRLGVQLVEDSVDMPGLMRLLDKFPLDI
ncbi:AAA family ATPase [Desulfovibrio sp. OttesenSCG-928-A18]|nr:AAA family ATPase [Desulfovibrio sp. OttesenSCG-928-A18]